VGDSGGQSKVMVAARASPAERAAAYRAVKPKIIASLLLDGGTVEEPGHRTLDPDLPRGSGRRPARKQERK
jgi:hypothetical protein